MENPPPLKKQGLGALAWTGIGCGAIILLIVVGVSLAGAIYGPKIKQFAEDAQKNPTRTMATTMVAVSAGQIELVAEDDANKRYTVREKKTGKLTTMYWNEKAKKAEVVAGDFSAIPPEASAGAPSRATDDSAPPLEKK